MKWSNMLALGAITAIAFGAPASADLLGGTVTNPTGTVTNTTTTVTGTVTNTTTTVGGTVTGTTGSVGGTVSGTGSTGSTAGGIVTDTGSTVGGVITSGGGTIGAVLETAGETLGTGGTGGGTGGTGGGTGGTDVGGLISGVGTTVGGAVEQVLGSAPSTGGGGGGGGGNLPASTVESLLYVLLGPPPAGGGTGSGGTGSTSGGTGGGSNGVGGVVTTTGTGAGISLYGATPGDVKGPRLKFKVLGRLKKAAKTGQLRIRIRSSEPSVVAFNALVRPGKARRVHRKPLKVSRKLIHTKTILLAYRRAGALTLSVELPKKARRALGRVKNARVNLQAWASDLSRNQARKNVKRTVKR